MRSYLHIHRENTSVPQERYRGSYELRSMSYELSRAVTRKGEINSDVRGGSIRVVIAGFADSLLMAWLFDGLRREDGAIITLDEDERSIEKLHFANASATSFRLNYDSRAKEGVTMVVQIEAKEIVTANDLHFESR